VQITTFWTAQFQDDGWSICARITELDTPLSLELAVHTWQAVDYADGLVRIGVQSAIAHPKPDCLFVN